MDPGGPQFGLKEKAAERRLKKIAERRPHFNRRFPADSLPRSLIMS
jgi:hypothetical protein